MPEEKMSAGREICFSTPWMEIQALHPAGGNGSPHYVVATKDYVSVLALTSGNVLLVRQFRPAVGAVTLELPAGHVESGQTPAVAAAAELMEETGFRAASMELLGCIDPDTGRLTNKNWCFVATDLEKVQADREHGETAELVVVPLEELGEMIRDGRFNHAQHLAAIHLAMMKGKIEFGPVTPNGPAQGEQRRAFVPTSPAVADVCIVGGAGHVGLPLSLVLAQSGMRVMIYDTNEKALANIARGQLPFVEHGAQALLDDALMKRLLLFTHDPAASRGVPNLIVTIGTPVDEFLNPDVGVIRRWVEGFLPHL